MPGGSRRASARASARGGAEATPRSSSRGGDVAPKSPKVSQKAPATPKVSQKAPATPKVSQKAPATPKVSQKAAAADEEVVTVYIMNFTEGEHVMAKWPGTNLFFNAKVTFVRDDDNEYDVQVSLFQF